MARSSKPSHDFLGLGLGLISWIFPDIPMWLKITISAIVVGLIFYLSMSMAKRDRLLHAIDNTLDKALTNFIVPFIGGVFRGALVSLIIVVILDHFFHVRLIHHPNTDSFNTSSGSSGLVYLLLHAISNLNSTGTAIVIIVAIIVAFTKVEEARDRRNEILLNSVVAEYTFATYKGASRFLWMVNHQFEFSYNEKTYRHKEPNVKKGTDLSGTLYQIKFYPGNPNVAKIVWDNPPSLVTTRS